MENFLTQYMLVLKDNNHNNAIMKRFALVSTKIFLWILVGIILYINAISLSFTAFDANDYCLNIWLKQLLVAFPYSLFILSLLGVLHTKRKMYIFGVGFLVCCYGILSVFNCIEVKMFWKTVKNADSVSLDIMGPYGKDKTSENPFYWKDYVFDTQSELDLLASIIDLHPIPNPLMSLYHAFGGHYVADADRIVITIEKDGQIRSIRMWHNHIWNNGTVVTISRSIMSNRIRLLEIYHSPKSDKS